MKRKGFTLVELLVVIVILGIITGLSIPLIRNIQEQNTKKQYKTYADILKQSAKLYVNSYEEDLFGHKRSGCAYVSYADLEKRGLIKDIGLSDVSCNSDNTFVRIVKLENKYTYSVYMGCGAKGNSGKVSSIDLSYPELNHVYEMDSDICGGMAGHSSAISVTAVVPTNYKKIHSTKISLNSPTGISNMILYAAWRKDKNFSAVSDSDWERASFNQISDQRTKIENGEFVSTDSQSFITPSNQTGEYFLLVKVEQLDDLYGEKWKNPQTNDSEYLWFGPFKVDNTNPTCSVSKTSGVGTTGGVTVRVTCQDADSQCTEATHDYSSLKASTTYTVTDNVGNSGTCSVSISSSNCNPYDCNCSDCYTGSNTCRPGKVCDAYAYECEDEFGHILSRQRFCPVNCATACEKVCYREHYSSCATGSNTCKKGCDTCYRTCYS